MKRWTNEEEKYLEENYSKINVTTIMKHLDRSYHSVKRKAQNMELEKDIYDGGFYFSTGDVMQILGLAKSTVLYYVKMGYIKCKILKSFNKNYKKFTVENLVDFMVKYPKKWSNKNYDLDTIQLIMLDYSSSKDKNKGDNLEFIKALIDKPKDFWNTYKPKAPRSILPTLEEKIQAI